MKQQAVRKRTAAKTAGTDSKSSPPKKTLSEDERPPCSDNTAAEHGNNEHRGTGVEEDLIVQKITALRNRGKALGLTDDEIRAYFDSSTSPKLLTRYVPKFHIYKTHFRTIWRRGLFWSELTSKVFSPPWKWNKYVRLTFVLAIALLLYRPFMAAWTSLNEDECLLESGPILDELVRPLFPCEVCQNLTSVAEVRNLTREEFVRSFGYSGLPVLIKGAARHWKALEHFSFEYFKSLYLNNTAALEVTREQCQFFHYNTEFESLEDALSMNPDRAAFKQGQRPWYIGWSNCDPAIAEQLRDQYERPYFLPVDAESSALDWIFMGGSGVGAGVHIDRVDLPSWQAQVSGTKTWDLIPSPECSAVCRDLQVTVHKGDILVVDTNAWYHSTFVHPGEISITIGSEYD